jgi:hypothetical protein
MPSETELASTERLKNLVKLTGNISMDVLKNLQAMLLREMKNDSEYSSKFVEIYDNDSNNIPNFPAIALEFKEKTTTRRTIGKDCATFQDLVFIDVWYYHADVNSKMINTDIQIAMDKISGIIRKNADLNGYCRKGVDILSARFSQRPVSGKMIAGACISISACIYYRSRAAGPG